MGLGGSDLCRVRGICRVLYFQVARLGFRGDGREYPLFRSCRRGAGRESRVGGRDWAWWRGKALKLVDIGVVLYRCITFLSSLLFPAWGCLVS